MKIHLLWKAMLACLLLTSLTTIDAMGTEGINDPAPFAKDQNDLNKYPIPSDISAQLNTNGGNITDWVKPVANQPLLFTTVKGINSKEITLKPYYAISRERYVIYWDLK